MISYFGSHNPFLRLTFFCIFLLDWILELSSAHEKFVVWTGPPHAKEKRISVFATWAEDRITRRDRTCIPNKLPNTATRAMCSSKQWKDHRICRSLTLLQLPWITTWSVTIVDSKLNAGSMVLAVLITINLIFKLGSGTLFVFLSEIQIYLFGIVSLV